MNERFSQAGMTLIEIMIALLIGVFLSAGAIQIFLDSKRIYRMQDGLSRLQENGRFAMDYLAKDIRMSGFLGCDNKATITNTLNTPTGFLYNFASAIEGFDSTSATAWTPTLNTAVTTLCTSSANAPGVPTACTPGGSDVITIRKASEDKNFNVVTYTNTTGSSDLTLDTVSTITACDIMVASDCSKAAIFQVTQVTSPTIKHASAGTACTAPKNSTDLLDIGTLVSGTKKVIAGNPKYQVYPINTISFYIGTNSSGKPSLYRATSTGQAASTVVELVEGIEQMQISYGVDTDATPDGTANYYVPVQAAWTATNWAKVVSVRISLLAVTLDDNLTTQKVPYIYNSPTNAKTTPNDYKLRRVFTTTIALRNRIT